MCEPNDIGPLLVDRRDDGERAPRIARQDRVDQIADGPGVRQTERGLDARRVDRLGLRK